jgi:hypothetical protein
MVQFFHELKEKYSKNQGRKRVTYSLVSVSVKSHSDTLPVGHSVGQTLCRSDTAGRTLCRSDTVPTVAIIGKTSLLCVRSVHLPRPTVCSNWPQCCGHPRPGPHATSKVKCCHHTFKKAIHINSHVYVLKLPATFLDPWYTAFGSPSLLLLGAARPEFGSS